MKTNKIFLLFGASGDLGNAASGFFKLQNYDRLYLFARDNPANSDPTGRCVYIRTGDMTVEENLKNAFSNISKKREESYFLLSTIGGYKGGKIIAETDYSEFANMLDLNLKTSFLISKHFAGFVEGTSGGSICFISALSSLTPEAGKASYNISKNGLNMLVSTLALEGKSIGLRANAIAPFAIDTASNREWITDVSTLVKPVEICQKVQSLFEDSGASGKIIQMPEMS